MVAQSLVTTVIFGLTYWVAFAMTFAMTASGSCANVKAEVDMPERVFS